MSNTRHASDNTPTSQEKYMSDPDYVEFRGISGTAVAARVSLLDNRTKRSLLLWVQARSLEPGGLKNFVREVLSQFSGRIGTPSMHKFGMKPGQLYDADEVKQVRNEIPGTPEQYPEALLSNACRRFPLYGEVDPIGRYLERMARDDNLPSEIAQKKAMAGKHPRSYPAAEFVDYCRAGAADSLHRFLIDLCINPRVRILLPDERGEESAADSSVSKSIDEFPELTRQDFRVASLWWFRDIVGALLKCKQQYEAAVRKDFVLTTIGRQVWETLDFALHTRRMVLVHGKEGIGKSEAVKAWVRIHQGEARFVSLKGISGKTNVFREISKVLGLACTYTRKAIDMQNRIEDVLHRSGLALIFDEAHFFLDLRPRMSSRPELLDWIDTSLCNATAASDDRLPVGLISTPQLLQSVQQAGEQVGWNWRQWRRRVKRLAVLPEANTQSDLEAVAAKLLPGLTRAGIKLAVGYALLSKRDLSSISDVAEEAFLLAEKADRRTIRFEDVQRVINDYLLPSDKAFAERLENPRKPRRGKFSQPAAEPAQDPSELGAESPRDDGPVAGECNLEFPGRGTAPALDRGVILPGETSTAAATA